MKWNRFFLSLAVVQLVAPAYAQGRLEIITLRHRPADQVLPALQPMVEPGGAISVMGDKILLRVSPANLAELRAALAAIDTPLRRLVVSVRQGDERGGESAALGVSGRIGPRDSALSIQGGARRSQSVDSVSQQVEVVEGGRALIRIGQSLPLVMREWRPGPGGNWVQVDSVQYADVGTGFYAAPQVFGNRVNVEISPSMERLGADGMVESSRLSTTVSGPLGVWIPLGSSQTDGRRSEFSLGGAGQGSSRSSAQVWLRVDAME